MSYYQTTNINNSKNGDTLQDLPEQKYKKKKVNGFIVAVNIILYGFGSILLINFLLRAFIDKRNIQDDHFSFQSKNELDVMKFKLDQIFQIVYLHSSCLLAVLFLKLFQSQKPIKQVQNVRTNMQQLSLNEELSRLIYSFPFFSVFFLNSIYSAWINTSQIQMKKLIFIIILHLATHIYNQIANISHQVPLINAIKNLMISISIATHLIIILNNNNVTNPLKIE
ncbi:hypothetical protein ABPG72_005795 [Tetrahymena utriculariae]